MGQKDKNRGDNTDLDLELEELADLLSDEGDGEDDGFDDGHPNETPIKGRKFWGFLILAIIVISVAVLYVYQVGDNKTILGNQPIPAAQPYPAPSTTPSTVAFNAPAGGLNRAPKANNFNPQVNTPANRGQSRQGQEQVQCPNCKEQGLPLCGKCGSTMQSLNAGSTPELFACPHCGTVGLAICPRCGGKMGTANATVTPNSAQTQLNRTQTVTQNGGQFFCSACGTTDLPNWDATGLPRCPGCNQVMTVR